GDQRQSQGSVAPSHRRSRRSTRRWHGRHRSADRILPPPDGQLRHSAIRHAAHRRLRDPQHTRRIAGPTCRSPTRCLESERQPPAAVRTLQDIYSKSMERVSFTLVMLSIAGAMALLIGIVGLYGVISYAVSQRRREIGIRMALGAPQRDMAQMFIRSGVMLA